MPFRLPNNSEHLSVIGQNGTGKTQLAVWVLSRANFSEYDIDGKLLPDEQRYYIDRKGWQRSRAQPWIIIDYKRERLLNNERLKKRIVELSLSSPLPKKPGLYIVHPQPWDSDALEDFLYRIWNQENIGVYFDEAHMIPKQDQGAFQALLTQGRSKHIPLIVLTQKPSWVSRFVFSEAKYFSIFHVQDIRDQKTVQQFAPVSFSNDLPEYWSKWYDTRERKEYDLQPVPAASTLIATLEARLPRRWWR
jgi:hypothetical protein